MDIELLYPGSHRGKELRQPLLLEPRVLGHTRALCRTSAAGVLRGGGFHFSIVERHEMSAGKGIPLRLGEG